MKMKKMIKNVLLVLLILIYAAVIIINVTELVDKIKAKIDAS